MSELGQGSRALVSAARQAERMSAEDKARIRGKINQRIATGVALGSVFTASSAAAKIGVWLPTAGKVLAIAVVSTSVGYVSLHRVVPHRTPASRAAETAVTHRAPHRAPLDRGIVIPAAAASAVSVESAASDGAAAKDESAGAVGSADAVVSVAATAPSATVGAVAQAAVSKPPLAGWGIAAPKPAMSRDASHQAVEFERRSEPSSSMAGESRGDPIPDNDLARQVAAIRESRAATRRGDPEAALAALERAASDGQAGPLEQEFILTQIAAHCLQGNQRAARELANSFLLRFPQSPLSRRVRATCAWDPNTQP